MKALLDIKKIVLLGLILTINLIAVSVLAKDEEIKYEKDGMTFVVGKHEPDKRVHEKQKEVSKTKEIIIHKQIVTSTTHKQEEESENTEKITQDDTKQEGKDAFVKWDDGFWNIAKSVILRAEVIFEDTVTFLGRITFMDRVTFADKDMAGNAVIKKGDKEVRIVYEKQFITKPVVSITAKNTINNFAIKNESEKGFTIFLDSSAKDNIEFSWIAIKIADFKTFKSKKNSKKTEVNDDENKKIDEKVNLEKEKKHEMDLDNNNQKNVTKEENKESEVLDKEKKVDNDEKEILNIESEDKKEHGISKELKK